MLKTKARDPGGQAITTPSLGLRYRVVLYSSTRSSTLSSTRVLEYSRIMH